MKSVQLCFLLAILVTTKAALYADRYRADERIEVQSRIQWAAKLMYGDRENEIHQ